MSTGSGIVRIGTPVFFLTLIFGLSGCDGDEKIEPQSYGLFSVNHSHLFIQSGKQTHDFQFGQGATMPLAVNLPFAGDFNGDGWDSPALYDPVSHQVEIKEYDGSTTRFEFGTELALPVAGDWDGDGIDSVGLYYPEEGRFVLQSGNNEGEILSVSFGPRANLDTMSSDEDISLFPVAGDFNMDGIDTLAVYDSENAVWYLAMSNQTEPVVSRFSVDFPEAKGAMPFASDWLGMGVDFFGLYNQDTHTVYRKRLFIDQWIGAELSLGEKSWEWLPVFGNWHPDYFSIENPTGHKWNTADAKMQGFDEAKLDLAMEYADDLPLLNSLLIVRNGKLIEEEYFHGHTAHIHHNLKSASKSILSALIGNALRDGYLEDVEQSVSSIFPELIDESSLKNHINIMHLLTMTAGLAWEENGPIDDEVSATGNMLKAVLEQPLISAPGEAFNYSSGLTHIASCILERVTGGDTLTYANNTLFNLLDINIKIWNRDATGCRVGGWDMWMLPRDMAFFGQLYLNGGRYNGNQVVAEEWVQATTQTIIDLSVAAPEGQTKLGYGAWWWTTEINGMHVYSARGAGGQDIHVIPDLKLVVAMTSNYWTEDELLSEFHADEAIIQLLTLIINSVEM